MGRNRSDWIPVVNAGIVGLLATTLAILIGIFAFRDRPIPGDLTAGFFMLVGAVANMWRGNFGFNNKRSVARNSKNPSSVNHE